MTINIQSGALFGIEGKSVQVEVDLLNRLPCITIVGLPGNAIRESADRVRSAIQQTGYEFPRKRVIINLAPAGLKKKGAFFDLPIAIGILQANGQIPHTATNGILFAGELSLSGSLRPIKGALALTLLARELNCKCIVLPTKNYAEACIVKDMLVYGFPTLANVVSWLYGKTNPPAIKIEKQINSESKTDMDEVYGHKLPKRALEIAAAGGHNILMMGSPGCGKTMLASRLPSILPTLNFSEALEITQIHSVRRTGSRNGLIQHRPFRAPHHSISRSGMIGNAQLLPGEASLAHNGVLFLDEIAEFRRDVLEALRNPLEDGTIQLTRATGSVTFPANFSLVAAANPCPCGWLYHPQKECRCSPSKRQRYQNKISGPLRDRIDLQVWVPPVPIKQLLQNAKEESSISIRKRVEKARGIQHVRFKNTEIHCNAQIKGKNLQSHLQISPKDKEWIIGFLDKHSISARGLRKIIKVARTIADLESNKGIERQHLIEALSYKNLLEVSK
jgi:magnesium chelatase family protein